MACSSEPPTKHLSDAFSNTSSQRNSTLHFGCEFKRLRLQLNSVATMYSSVLRCLVLVIAVSGSFGSASGQSVSSPRVLDDVFEDYLRPSYRIDSTALSSQNGMRMTGFSAAHTAIDFLRKGSPALEELTLTADEETELLEVVSRHIQEINRLAELAPPQLKHVPDEAATEQSAVVRSSAAEIDALLSRHNQQRLALIGARRDLAWQGLPAWIETQCEEAGVPLSQDQRESLKSKASEMVPEIDQLAARFYSRIVRELSELGGNVRSSNEIRRLLEAADSDLSLLVSIVAYQVRNSRAHDGFLQDGAFLYMAGESIIPRSLYLTFDWEGKTTPDRQFIPSSFEPTAYLLIKPNQDIGGDNALNSNLNELAQSRFEWQNAINVTSRRPGTGVITRADLSIMSLDRSRISLQFSEHCSQFLADDQKSWIEIETFKHWCLYGGFVSTIESHIAQTGLERSDVQAGDLGLREIVADLERETQELEKELMSRTLRLLEPEQRRVISRNPAYQESHEYSLDLFCLKCGLMPVEGQSN